MFSWKRSMNFLWSAMCRRPPALKNMKKLVVEEIILKNLENLEKACVNFSHFSRNWKRWRKKWRLKLVSQYPKTLDRVKKKKRACIQRDNCDGRQLHIPDGINTYIFLQLDKSWIFKEMWRNCVKSWQGKKSFQNLSSVNVFRKISHWRWNPYQIRFMVLM